MGCLWPVQVWLKKATRKTPVDPGTRVRNVWIKDLIAWMSWLEQAGIGLRSLQEVLDTTSTSGKLTFHIFAALAEFEKQLIQERTQAGLKAARARGRLGGRPKALKPGRQQRAVQLYHAKELTVKEICEMMGISKPTLYAYVREAAL